MSRARKEILNRLKNIDHPEPGKPDLQAHVYPELQGPLEQVFLNSLENVNGKVHIFPSKEKLFSALKTFLKNYEAKAIYTGEQVLRDHMNEYDIPFSTLSDQSDSTMVGITGCEYLVAHTGSIMVSSAQQGGRKSFIFPPVHVVIADQSQLVDYLENAYSSIRKKYRGELPSQVTIITGPSRTADIEKTLILGAHGPKELHVYISM